MTLAYERVRYAVVGAPIDVVTWEQTISRIVAWSSHRESRYVCICNVHSVVTARQDVAFLEVIAQADLATPDGAPVAWMLRRLGGSGQQRINGPDLMWRYCAEAQARGESIFLYGGTAETLQRLQARLSEAFPNLSIAGAISPPFRVLTDEEKADHVTTINMSGAGVVWVGLGCPKQEFWMAEHRGRIQAVMVGVGAAFDYHAGVVSRAPLWMRDAGLEWLHRLCSEPRRLWRRYLFSNVAFILATIRQLLLVALGRRY